MAKAKSKKITIEDALVPVEEQPYEVPENWCWVKLDPVTLICTGKKDANYGSEDGEYYFFTCASEPIRCDNYSFDTKAILLAGNGDIGNISIYNGKFEVYQRTYVVEAKKSILTEYLYYYFKFRWVDYNIDKMYGTAIPYIRLGNLKDYEVPLPPLAEQQRIVEQIENLFSKLDEAKEKIQTVIDTAEERRESILYKAFRGELTNKWREENNKNIDNWESAKVKDICVDVKVGIVIKPTQYYTDSENGTPAFRSANVRETYIEDNDWVYLNEQGVKDNKRSEVHSGDVLIVRSGNPGTACVVTDQYDGYNAIDIIIAVPNKEKILPDFLCYYTNSPECKGLVKENKRGMALQHFNVGSYSKLPIRVPSLEEQAEIVLILKEVLQKEENAMDIAEQFLNQIELIKKSILSKAFRGELGTNDLSEESSIELLRQIIES